MKIIINAKEESIDKSVTIAELLVIQKVKIPDMVSVSLNGEFIRRENFPSTSVKENDSVDFLYFMGGGRIREEAYPE